MAKVTDKIAVNVSETNSDNGTRQIIAEIEVPAALLSISELLAQEGINDPLSQVIKQSLKKSIAEHIAQGRSLLRNAAIAHKASGSAKSSTLTPTRSNTSRKALSGT